MENAEGWRAEGVTEGVVPRMRLIATPMLFLFEGRFPSSPPVADSDDGNAEGVTEGVVLLRTGVLLQSRFARQTFGVPLAYLPHRGRQAPRSQRWSPFEHFMTLCFSIRKNSFYLQSRPPSSREVARQRRDGRSRPPSHRRICRSASSFFTPASLSRCASSSSRPISSPG